jgi:hypothetical protein
MNCLFCPTQSLTIYNLSKNVTDYDDYECPKCKTLYCYKYNSELIFLAYRINYNNSDYRITYYGRINETQIRDIKYKLILELNGRCNLTPTNIISKLPILLTFQ